MVYILTPLSWLYGLATGLRNWLFDSKFLKEQVYDIPIIGVGNITVGGTGKTPLSRLRQNMNISGLSAAMPWECRQCLR